MDIKQLLGNELLPKESIIWSGQPALNLFTRGDMFLIPFSIMWGGFAVFWEVSVLLQGAPIFAALWGIPFVLVGLYVTVGRFIYKLYIKKRTYYVLTDQRAIVFTYTNKRKFNAVFLQQLPSINKSGSGVLGTIRFGNQNQMDAMYGNTGADFMTGMYGQISAPTFYDVPDVDHVYMIANQARQKLA